MVNGKDDEPTKSKRDRFLNTNKNAPLPDRLHSTAVASFKSKTLTIKKNFDLIQLNVPKGQDYFWGIRNNIQSETCARGVASKKIDHQKPKMNTEIDAQTISPEAQCKIRAKCTSQKNVYKAQDECTSDTMTDICQFKFKLKYEIQECIERQKTSNTQIFGHGKSQVCCQKTSAHTCYSSKTR